uniref:Ricin B-type lectin domain-containing protein n=1 Tax=Macrostomum lignano TaxID=282301 RepID=A0A1I8HSK1_9PLAT
TICPEISDPWKPVVYVNKCFYRKNDANINITAVTNWSPCGTNGQLFDVKDSDAETQLVKYVNYLSDIGNPIAEFWAQDSRNGSLSPCDTDGVNARNLFPICQRTLCFPGASPADFVIIQIGSSGLLWYHFNSSQVTKSNSCTGSQMASMESSDAFQHIKDGIVQRGWLGQPVWISSTGGYLPGGLSGCIALTINSTADSISMAASSVDCNSNLRQVCTYGFNNGGSSGGSSQSHGIVTDICPLSSQPPSDAQLVRTVGNLCYYHTGSSKSLSTTTDPNAACDSSGGKYKPALIDADYNKAKNYIFSIMGSVGTSWEAWMWTSNPGESLTSTNGDPITITVSGSGGYYMNRTGSPFKGNSSADRPVICRSDAEVCPSSLNYLNYASSSNSCVALQTTEASQAACATNCNGLGGGSLVQLESQEKYGQVRDVILING